MANPQGRLRGALRQERARQYPRVAEQLILLQEEVDTAGNRCKNGHDTRRDAADVADNLRHAVRNRLDNRAKQVAHAGIQVLHRRNRKAQIHARRFRVKFLEHIQQILRIAVEILVEHDNAADHLRNNQHHQQRNDCQADNVRQQNGESAALFASAEEVLHRCFNNWVKAVGNHHTARERRKDAQNAVHTVQEGLRVEQRHVKRNRNQRNSKVIEVALRLSAQPLVLVHQKSPRSLPIIIVQKRPAVNRFDSFLTFFSFFGREKGRIPANAPFSDNF